MEEKTVESLVEELLQLKIDDSQVFKASAIRVGNQIILTTLTANMPVVIQTIEEDEDGEEVSEQSDSSDIGKGDNQVKQADGSDEEDAVPTTFIDCLVFDYVPVDTVYVEVVDTLYVTEYIDCITGLPCGNTGILELLQKTKNENKIYNLNGKEIYRRENIYIEDGI